MHSLNSQKVLPNKKCAEEEGWGYLEEGTLRMSRSACVCMTCQYFGYACDMYSKSLLTCRAHHKLIPQGSHLTCRCPLWHTGSEDQYGFCPEVA
ncbi:MULTISPECIES: galactose oxidase [Prochlorococcus]|uniref:galactose oxidase n=1 Tax=Prochlorococcus TaxID=1218 RepID=UPI0009078193|nr:MULTISPECIES: galactose oxidase [Prochlorococcus]